MLVPENVLFEPIVPVKVSPASALISSAEVVALIIEVPASIPRSVNPADEEPSPSLAKYPPVAVNLISSPAVAVEECVIPLPEVVDVFIVVVDELIFVVVPVPPIVRVLDELPVPKLIAPVLVAKVAILHTPLD